MKQYLLTTVLFVSFMGTCCFCTVLQARPQVTPLITENQLLWINGIAGVREYRCPLLTYTPNGHLLAIVEGRKLTTSDASSKFIAIKRSTDQGFTWGNDDFIYDDGYVSDGDNLGAVLVDDETKALFLFFTLCPHRVGCTTTSMMYVKSVDDGISWDKQVNISAIITGNGSDMAFGPGRGIQLKHGKHKGRLVVCGHRSSLVECILSDDHGKSWRYGLILRGIPGFPPLQLYDFAPNEVQVEELSDGTLLLNMRNQENYHCKCRIIGRSNDGGETLPMQSITFDSTLVSSPVSGNILMHNGVLFFSNPASSSSRVNMTLRWSYDDGASWSGTLQIWEYASGYSCMTAMPDYIKEYKKQKFIYIVYEKGFKSSTESVGLAKISLDGVL